MQENVKRKPALLTGGLKLRESDNGKILPVCFLCNQVPAEGMRSGFFLKGIFICARCEQELISSEAADMENYKHAIEKLREILFKKSPGKRLPELT